MPQAQRKNPIPGMVEARSIVCGWTASASLGGKRCLNGVPDRYPKSARRFRSRCITPILNLIVAEESLH